MAVIFRDAIRADVPAIMNLLMDDLLGAAREGAPIEVYLAAYEDIAATPTHQLIVGEQAGEIVACCQLTLLYGLSRKGGRRALVEAVRVAPQLRSHGIGAALMAECENRARAAGATLIQLTTDKSRLRAHAFYQRLGYVASHMGYKKPL